MADPVSPEITYLLSLKAVRERSRLVLQAAKEGALNSFDYDEPRMNEVSKVVIDIIKVRIDLSLSIDTISGR